MMKTRFFAFLLMLLGVSGIAAAQQQRNYIYIFDCTRSMLGDEFKQGTGPNLWNPARQALDRTISRQVAQPGSHYTIIPFQDKVLKTYSFDNTNYQKLKTDLDKDLNGYIDNITNTNLYDAFVSGMAACDPNMQNRVYLLTDGEDNVRGMEALLDAISKWCSSHRNTRFFYVMLNDVAARDGRIDQVMMNCSDAYTVKCRDGIIPSIADIGDEIHASTLELDKAYRLPFSEPGTYKLKVSTTDPVFNAEIIRDEASGNELYVRFTPREASSIEELNDRLAPMAGPGGIYPFDIEITSDDPDFFIANPRVKVNMANRARRALDILGGEATDEYVIEPGADWYPSFLWSKAKDDETLEFDLGTVFNKASGPSTAASFSVQPADGQTADFQVTVNGEPIASGHIFIITPEKPDARIGITFNHAAATGKRYFRIVNEGTSELELINGRPAAEMESIPFRTTYSTSWNPLATFFFWLGVAILSALVLWFLIGRRTFYPSIKAKTIEIAGPDSYYLSPLKIKGKRSIVLTAQPRRQNVLSRIFTGKTLYVVDPVWTPELTISAGGRGSIRVNGARSYTTTPSARLRPGDQGEIYNNSTGKTSTISVE